MQPGPVLPMQVGDVELLVQTVRLPVSEQTAGGRLDRAGQRIVEGCERAQSAIEAIAEQMAGTLRTLGERAVRPDRMDVEFGLSFTAKGDLLVAGSSVEACLKITIGYDRSSVITVVDGDPPPPE